MNEQMEFPETFEEFAKEYGFKDDVYTNGSDLIQIFRVKQWLEHDNKLRRIETDTAYECGKHANKTLDQEPSSDMVSRGVFEQIMWERDVAIEQLKELGYELGQKVEPCEDAISRQATLGCLTATGLKKFDFILDARDKIKNLPPVTPQPKMGKWIKSRDSYGNNHFTCPFCEHDIATKGDTWEDNYCSNCGAKLDEVEDGNK